ncbi:hypothetical protein [Mycobacterium sp. MUNTM1]
MSNDPCPSCDHPKVRAIPDSCIDCGRELTQVFEGDVTSRQYRNALGMTLTGGYGMFFDDTDPVHRIFLCHDCAHGLCDALPWLANLVEPERSHLHTAQFWAAHPDHEGCDKPANLYPT